MSIPSFSRIAGSRLPSRSTIFDPGLLRRRQAGQKIGRVDRRGDQRDRLALQHRVADIELVLDRLIAFHRLHEIGHAGRFRAGLHAFAHRAPERVGEGLHQDRVIAIRLGRCNRQQRCDGRGAEDSEDLGHGILLLLIRLSVLICRPPPFGTAPFPARSIAGPASCSAPDSEPGARCCVLRPGREASSRRARPSQPRAAPPR